MATPFLSAVRRPRNEWVPNFPLALARARGALVPGRRTFFRTAGGSSSGVGHDGTRLASRCLVLPREGRRVDGSLSGSCPFVGSFDRLPPEACFLYGNADVTPQSHADDFAIHGRWRVAYPPKSQAAVEPLDRGDIWRRGFGKRRWAKIHVGDRL